MGVAETFEAAYKLAYDHLEKVVERYPYDREQPMIIIDIRKMTIGTIGQGSVINTLTDCTVREDRYATEAAKNLLEILSAPEKVFDRGVPLE